MAGTVAPELASALAETRELRALVEEILTAITPKSGTTSQYLLRQVDGWRVRAGLPPR